MNLLETYVTNITKVEFGLPYNCVRITADFNDDAGTKMQDTRIISMCQYKHIIEHGYYDS